MLARIVAVFAILCAGLSGAFAPQASDRHVMALPCLERALHIINKNQATIVISAHCTLPHFHHQLIIDCYCAMRDSQSVKPLFALWNQIRNLEFIDDPEITSDFIRFVIILCKAQLQSQLLPKKDTFDQMFALYDQIAALPIPQLLNLLDDIVNQYETFHEQYELNNQALTWSDWLQKYWWAPPIILISLFITYLKHSNWTAPQG